MLDIVQKVAGKALAWDAWERLSYYHDDDCGGGDNFDSNLSDDVDDGDDNDDIDAGDVEWDVNILENNCGGDVEWDVNILENNCGGDDGNEVDDKWSNL